MLPSCFASLQDRDFDRQDGSTWPAVVWLVDFFLSARVGTLQIVPLVRWEVIHRGKGLGDSGEVEDP